MSVVQAEAGWFGEGDDYFWVDGQKPSIEGTGSEDYFNDAWGLHVNDGPLLRRDRGRGHGPRLAHDRLSLASGRSDPVHEVAQGRDRAPGLDLQRRWRGQVRLRRAHRPDLQRRLLVPGRHRPGPAARALWLRPVAAGQRPANRGREVAGRVQSRRRQGLPQPGTLLVQGRHPLRRQGQGLEDRGALRRAGGRRLRALHGSRPGFRLRHLHRAARRQAAACAAARARAGRGCPPANPVRRLRARDLRRAGSPGRLGPPRQGTAHAHLRLPGQATRPPPATTWAWTTSFWPGSAPRPGPPPRK